MKLMPMQKVTQRRSLYGRKNTKLRMPGVLCLHGFGKISLVRNGEPAENILRIYLRHVLGASTCARSLLFEESQYTQMMTPYTARCRVSYPPGLFHLLQRHFTSLGDHTGYGQTEPKRG